MTIKKVFYALLTVSCASIALAGGVFVGAADGAAGLEGCDAAAETWQSASTVWIEDDTIELGWDDDSKQPVRISLDDRSCGDDGLEAFLEEVAEQSADIHRGDCAALRDTYDRAIRVRTWADLAPVGPLLPDAERGVLPLPGVSDLEPTTPLSDERIVALPNPHLQPEDLLGFEPGSPQSVYGELPPVLIDLNQVELVLQGDCAGF